jgi:hypothetical protein
MFSNSTIDGPQGGLKKNGSIVKKWGFSGIHRTSYTRKHPNLYPQQNRITLHTLP